MKSSNGPPLYRRVEADLQRKIETGHFPQGANLPTESELCRQYAASSITVRRALADLALDGLVETSRGRRTRVVSRVATNRGDVAMEGLIEGVLLTALSTQYRVVDFRFMRPSREVATFLRLPRQVRVHRSATVATKNGRLFAYTVSYVPESLGRMFSREQLEAKPHLLWLKAAGVDLDSGSQFLGVRPASKETTAMLHLPVRSPVVLIQRTIYDRRGHGVEYAVANLPWDRYEYEVRLHGLR